MGAARLLPARARDHALASRTPTGSRIGNKYVPSSYDYIGLSNYKDILTSSEFRRVAEFSVIWTFVNVFFHFTIGLVLAVTLNRQIRFRGIYRMLLMVPWAVPSFISAFAWRFIYNNPYGFLDQFLMKLGWHDPPAFLGDPTWAKFAVIMTNVWLGVPFMMVALLGGLQAIDNDLLDAAAVDGASAWRRFWDVTMPGPAPGRGDRDPARPDLDVQHVQHHLPDHGRRARRTRPRSSRPSPTGRPSPTTSTARPPPGA